MDTTNRLLTALSGIRRRWRRVEIAKVLAAAVVEVAGLLLVFMLADWLYRFPTRVRLGLLAAGAATVAVVLAVHVARVIARSRRIGNADLALFVESRSPGLQGALLAATEFGGSRGTPLHNYIVEALVSEANRRVQMVDVRKAVDLRRLKKYGLACAAMLVAFIATGAFFPQFIERQGRRILTPWVVRPEDNGAGGNGEEFYDVRGTGPVRFRVLPGDAQVLEGGSVEIVAELSRDPLGLPTTLYIRSGGEKAEWEPVAMQTVERLYTHKAVIEDINRPIEYYVAAGKDASEHHAITVRQRLKVTGVEMTTEFPSYLRRAPEKAASYSGDIATLAGSKVTLDIKTNQPLREGFVVMGDGSRRPLDLGASGGRIALPITKDDTYRYVVRNDFGEEVGADRVYFIQALEDRPPLLEVMEPNTDLTVTPLTEVTCVLNVTEDWALDSVRMQLEIIRQGPNQEPLRTRETRDFLPAAWTGRVDGGASELVVPMEAMAPQLKPGDSIFYHFEAADRKGQKAMSDLYFISIAEPEVFVYYGTLDWHAPKEKVPISPMMQIIAAAWRLEQERATLAKDEFLAQCAQLADKMIDPTTGKLVDFIRLGADGSGKGPILAESDPRKKIAADHTKLGSDLLRKGEPGQAVVEFKIVWAILKQFFGDASIMLAAADVENPNRVILEKGEYFTAIEQLTNISRRELDRELAKAADQQVAWRRSLGRKEMEKVDEARKNIREIKKDVKDLADQAREGEPRPPEAGQENKDQPKDTAAGDQKADEKKTKPSREGDATDNDKPKDESEKDNETGDEKKPTDAQAAAGDNKPNNSKKKPDAAGKGDLKDQALDAARRAEDVAKALAGVMADQKDKAAKDGLDRLRNAADELRRAALDFDEKKLDEAANRAETAHRMLDDAERDLGKLTAGQLADMVAQALAHAHRMNDRQKTLTEATGALDKSAEAVRQGKEKGDRTAAAQEEVLRERQKGVATAQSALGDQAQAFKDFVERMHESAATGEEENAARALEEGVRAMKRDELPQKMVDAAVEVQLGNFKAAKDPQDQSSKTLRAVIDSLYRASDALSGTKEGALARAAKRAKEIKEKGLDLAGLKEKDLPGADATKPDAKPDAKPETKPDTGAEKGDDLSKRRRGEEASKLWGEVKTLAGDLQSMDDVPQAAKDRISEVGEADFTQGFEDKDRKKTAEFLALIARISTILDEKLAEARDAKRLEAGLRDECPPGYRRLVGRYYSILSAGE